MDTVVVSRTLSPSNKKSNFLWSAVTQKKVRERSVGNNHNVELFFAKRVFSLGTCRHFLGVPDTREEQAYPELC